MKKSVKILIIGIFILGLINEITIAYTYPSIDINDNTNDINKPRWDDRWEEYLSHHSPNTALRLIGLISIVINIILLVILLFIYMRNFKSTKSNFMLGLSFFIGVLLMQKLIFYFFPIVPQVFETISLIILLILSIE